ncbi:MAG: SDR family oxidoreductase [Phycisphaerales bacterium]|nr:SDR family oxidoreductase [Phycisphaerales bacterium]
MTLPLSNRNALVCGSTQGIGRACAVEFARLGAHVVLVGRNGDGLSNVFAELPRPAQQEHGTLLVDFADWKAVEQVGNDHATAHGPVHILLNNTGGPPAGALFDASGDDLVKAFQMHIVCAQVLARAVAPGMRDAGYGRIMNIVSTSVVTPIRGLGVSNVVRAAMGNWMRTLAHELGPFGITVNNILPGFTKTARLDSIFKGRASRAGTSVEEVEQEAMKTIPVRRLGTPEEIAAVAGFLAGPAAAYVNGVNLPVDGGRLAWQ